MNNMNPIFSLKNFRSFGEEGANFELAPITVLTGCNSAGKSSLVKALLLLSKNSKGGTSYSISGNRDVPSMSLKTSSVDLKLGGYRNVVHALTKDGEIELAYNMWSSFLHEEIVCKRSFHEKRGLLSDGELSCFSIEKKDGTVIYKGNLIYVPVIDGKGSEEFDESLDGEFVFDTISNNFNRFVLVANYNYFKRLHELPRNDSNNEKRADYHNEVDRRYKEAKMFLSQCGMTIDEAEAYGLEACRIWYERLSYEEDLLGNRSVRPKIAIVEKIAKRVLSNDEKDTIIEHETEEFMHNLFGDLVINEIVSPWFISRLTSIDSSTNKINRIYNVEDKDKLSVLLCDIVSKSSSYKYRTGAFVNKWLQTFGIGDSLEIEGTDEGLGVRIYVNKKGERRLLADEGCGLTQIVSILLQIDRLKKLNSYEKYDPESNEEFDAYHDSFISVEEPEVHLHPKYQSLLADMFVEAYQEFNIHFIIETHSEYLIRKLQVLVADKENKLTANDVSLNYVEKDENGVSTNRKIEILEDGSLNGTFGSGFYDEADTLALNLFRKKVILS